MADYIDTRDLNDRLEELESIESRLIDIDEEIVQCTDDDEYRDLIEEKDEISEDFIHSELKTLKDMRDEISEWEYGNTLIPDDDFTDYAIEMLKDCGDLPQNIPWYIEIDEEKTADNIKADYASIEYEGTDYWFRNC